MGSRKKMADARKYFLALACFAMLATGALAVMAPGPEPDVECPTIFDVASSAPQFSHLVDAVVGSGSEEIIGVATDPDAEVTLFAPDNDAFEAVAAAFETDVEGLISFLANDAELLETILAYHVVPAGGVLA